MSQGEGVQFHLKRKRLEGNLTQVELAYRSGVSYSTIQKIEGGGVRPGIPTAYRLATALGITIDDFLDEA